MSSGTLNPEKRVQQWTEKRVFFLTPQVLDNDLSRGTCPAKLIRCLVLDEAHRALGNHAYCQVGVDVECLFVVSIVCADPWLILW